MGLRCSHDAFHGAYSAFNRFRQFIAAAIGGSHPPHEYPDVEAYICKKQYGEGEAGETNLVADELVDVLRLVKENGRPKGFEEDYGHIESRGGGMIKVTEKFIRGLRRAAKTKKKGLVFA